MSTIPASVLSRFYERDSLRNTKDGFEVVFRNRLAPATLIGVGPLSIAGEQYSGEQVTIHLERPREGHTRPPNPLVRHAGEFVEGKPVQFGVNTVARVVVNGRTLSPGPYFVALALRTKEVGDITVTGEDEIAAGPSG